MQGCFDDSIHRKLLASPSALSGQHVWAFKLLDTVDGRLGTSLGHTRALTHAHVLRSSRTEAGYCLFLPPSRSWLTVHRQAWHSFLDATISESVTCWNTSPTQDEYSFKMHLETFLPSAWPPWRSRLLRFTLSLWTRFPRCTAGQVATWTGLRKDPTSVAKGEFQGCYWPNNRENTWLHLLCVSRGPGVSLVVCNGRVKRNSSLSQGPNSDGRVPSPSLFCHAISRVSQTLRFLSKYSSSQMAGTLLWRGRTRLKITRWCIIMLDGTRLSRFTQRDLFGRPASSGFFTPNIITPRARQTSTSAIGNWLVKQTPSYSSRLWIAGSSGKLPEDPTLGEISQDFPLGITWLYPKVSNISAPNFMDIYSNVC